MTINDRILDKLDVLDNKIDLLVEQTARQDERIKQNKSNLDSQRKKIWGAALAAIGAFGTIIANLFR